MIKHKTRQKGLIVRQIAIKILAAILSQKKSLDGLLDKQNGQKDYLALSIDDQNLCAAIITTALKYKALIDKQLLSYLKNNLPKNADNLRYIIYSAVAQIHYLNIPNYAAVNLAVECAKRDPRSVRFTSLVNAILHKFIKDGPLFTIEEDPIATVPEWFSNELINDFGKILANNIIIIQSQKASLDITVKNNPQKWAEKLNGYPLLNNSIRLRSEKKDITSYEGFKEGEWYVQNIAAAIPATLFGNIAGKKIADICAAPGGKTAQLILQKADVTAMEYSATRFKRLKQNLSRLQLKAELFEGPFQKFIHKNYFDGILLDAPCSSTGTIRRHSDVLWNKDLDDIQKLAQIQYDLLSDAIKLLKINGTLIFTNCSLNKIEGEKLINKFLAHNQNIQLNKITSEEFPHLKEFITDDGFIRTHPFMLLVTDKENKYNYSLSGMDGFFAARLTKIAN